MSSNSLMKANFKYLFSFSFIPPHPKYKQKG